jgi:hypothetical protein
MAEYPGLVMLLRPPPVAVHDNRYMPRQLVDIYLSLIIHFCSIAVSAKNFVKVQKSLAVKPGILNLSADFLVRQIALLAESRIYTRRNIR